MMNLKFIEHCAKNLILLFRITNENTKLQYLDVVDSTYLCEEIINCCIGSNEVCDDNTQFALDVCANALIVHFELDDDLHNIEARAIMAFIQELLEGYGGTCDEVNQPSLWNWIRDTIEQEYCDKEPYTDQLDITISKRTLEKRLATSLSDYCILNGN